MKRCPVTHKVKYPSSVDALLDLQHAPWKARAYLCPHCGFFHVRNEDKRLAKHQERRHAGED